MTYANTYVGVYKQLKNLPTLVINGNKIITGIKRSTIAKESKLYNFGGEMLQDGSMLDKCKLTEVYFKKLKGFTWYPEIPFFKKISETDGVNVKAFRTNGKGTSSLTNYDIYGIRTNRVTQKYNPKTEQYDYTRIVYNDKGTNPQIVSKWQGEYTPLKDLN